MLSSVFRLVVLLSCFLHVMKGQYLNWIEQDSNSLIPGNAQYYLSADTGSSVGPTDELKRTNRSLWKKLFKNTDLENLFCDNCNGNNNYGGGCSNPLHSLKVPLPIVTKPLKPLFGALPQLWGSSPSTYYPPPCSSGCGGSCSGPPASPYGSNGPYGSGYGGAGGYGGGSGYGANSAGGYNGPPSGAGGYSGPSPGGSGGYSAPGDSSGYNAPTRGGAGSYSAPAPGGSSDYSLPPPGGSSDYNSPASSGGSDYSQPAPSSGSDDGNDGYTAPSPTPTTVDNYESPTPSKPKSSYETPVAPASNSYSSESDSDYGKHKSTEQNKAKVPQILYQPIIYVSPQVQPAQSKKSSYGSESSDSNNKSYDNPTPVDPAYKPSAPAYDDQPEQQEPEPPAPAPVPAYTPPPVAPSIHTPPSPSCGGYMPIFGFPVYGISPPMAALPTPFYQNQSPWHGSSPLTPPNYSPSQNPAPTPSAYSSPNSISYSSAGSDSAKSEYSAPQPSFSSFKSPSPQSGSYVPPGVTTISTVYTVLTPPKPAVSSNLYSAPPSPSAFAPAPAPAPAYQASPLPVANPSINTYPIKLTYADQPYRSCPELFSEYHFQQALAAQTGNGY